MRLRELAGACVRYDTKAVRAIIRLLKRDQAERQEAEAILDLYMAALGMV